MIRYAESRDFALLKEHDRHIPEEELRRILPEKRVILIFDGDEFAGWLRYGLFWDNIPFMNMLYILEGFRGRSFGRELASFWEGEMAKSGFRRVLTSTQSDEQAQFFYRKIGYSECGALILPNEPLEMIFIKNLPQKADCKDRKE